MHRLWKYLAIIAITLVVLVLPQFFRSQHVASIPNNAGMKIISLAPHITTIIFALGLGDNVVGVTTYCDDPPSATLKTQVGDFIQPNLEMILKLDPDLILTQRSDSSHSSQKLRDLGQTVVEFSSPFSIEEIYLLIESVGRSLKKTDKALSLVSSMKHKVAKVRKRAKRLPIRPTIYIENDVPSWTIGGPTFTNEAISISGADNIFGDLDLRAPRVSEEMIIRNNPKIILSFVSPSEDILSRPGWDSIDAIKNHRIIDQFEHRLLVRANHRLADGMQSFQNLIFRQLGISEDD